LRNLLPELLAPIIWRARSSQCCAYDHNHDRNYEQDPDYSSDEGSENNTDDQNGGDHCGEQKAAKEDFQTAAQRWARLRSILAEDRPVRQREVDPAAHDYFILGFDGRAAVGVIFAVPP